MVKVYSAENSLLAGHIKNLLELEDIPCILKNMNISSAMGELPLNECWPEVWIKNQEDYKRAMEIINSSINVDSHTRNDWQCTCGEVVEEQFKICWKCGNTCSI